VKRPSLSGLKDTGSDGRSAPHPARRGKHDGWREDAVSGESDEHILACDMVDVHGAEAATVARENARAAALAGQAMQAKFWIRVLGMIQRSSGQSSAAPVSR
jgi:hypothetical protein